MPYLFVVELLSSVVIEVRVLSELNEKWNIVFILNIIHFPLNGISGVSTLAYNYDVDLYKFLEDKYIELLVSYDGIKHWP